MDRQTCKIQNIYNCLFIFRYNCNRCIPLFYFQMVRVKCKMVPCIYWALNKCVPGVLTMKELNNQIESHYIEMRRLNPNHKKDWSGIKNQTWHQACISKALSQKYGKGSYIWKKIRFKNLYHFLKSNKTGRFYIHGLLNYRLFSNNSSGNWTHAICIDIDDGKFYDNNYPYGRLILDWFINCNVEEMYLARIDRIYKLDILKFLSTHGYNLRKRINQ